MIEVIIAGVLVGLILDFLRNKSLLKKIIRMLAKKEPKIKKDSGEYKNIKNAIHESSREIENFKFNTRIEINLKNEANLVPNSKQISGARSIEIFISYLKKILENNLIGERGFTKGSLDYSFTDGIKNNIDDLKSLVLKIDETFEYVINSEPYKKRNFNYSYVLKEFIGKIYKTILEYLEDFIKIEQKLLPKVIQLCKDDNKEYPELSELLALFQDINMSLNIVIKYYILICFEHDIQKLEESIILKPILYDKASKIILQDKMGKLKIFAEHMPEKKSIEMTIDGLLYTFNIEDYIIRMTGKEVEIIEHKKLDKIKKVINQRDLVIIRNATWKSVKRYDGLGEGIIHWIMTKEKQVLINREGIDILNTYHRGLKKEISDYQKS